MAQTVNQFLTAPLPTIVPLDHTIQPVSYMTVAGSPYPKTAAQLLPDWTRAISTPFQALFNRSHNNQP